VLGLRLQIGLALAIAFAIAFGILGAASLELGRRERARIRAEDAQALAGTLATAMGESVDPERFDGLAQEALTGGVRGVSLSGPRVELSRGTTRFGDRVSAPVPGQAETEVVLWLEEAGAARGPFGDLWVFYIALTGLLILLLTYVALTFLIVRPLQQVTLASARLAEGRTEIEVPEQGAGEVRKLARSFNAMGRQVRADRAQLEERLAELEATTAELAQAEDQVLRSARLASVGRLAAGVAHEIGNPLTAVVGLIELARDGDIDAESRDELLERTTRETERIQRIIRDLLDFARPDDEGEDAVADAATVIEEAVRLVAPQKDTSAIRIERRLEAVGSVRGSADRLKQVVLNLLLNAVDAVDGEGEVIIELAADDEGALIAVSDDGPGIDPEVRDHLFEPFVTTKPVGQGTGLGLAVCHTIVERLGGSLRATEAPSGGARFELRLRLADQPS
jgi:two-component system NtrC family sensor kinase